MFGKHFRILNARMVQSVESVWTVIILNLDSDAREYWVWEK